MNIFIKNERNREAPKRKKEEKHCLVFRETIREKLANSVCSNIVRKKPHYKNLWFCCDLPLFFFKCQPKASKPWERRRREKETNQQRRRCQSEWPAPSWAFWKSKRQPKWRPKAPSLIGGTVSRTCPFSNWLSSAFFTLSVIWFLFSLISEIKGKETHELLNANKCQRPREGRRSLRNNKKRSIAVV